MQSSIGENMKIKLEQLSEIEISDDIFSRTELQNLVPKIKEVVAKLDENSEVLRQATDNNRLIRWWNSLTGSNDGIVLESEKILTESTKMTIGLAFLSTMFAKALKEQQDKLFKHQAKLSIQQVTIMKQQSEINQLNQQILEILDQHQVLSKSTSLKEIKLPIIKLLIITGIVSVFLSVFITIWLK